MCAREARFVASPVGGDVVIMMIGKLSHQTVDFLETVVVAGVSRCCGANIRVEP